jgi:hypothetical protein
MSGKKTFSKTKRHLSRVGGFVEGVELQPATWAEIEAITGGLSAEEHEAVIDALEVAKMMADNKHTPSQDVVATLTAIERLNDPVALEAAWKNCDATSRACLDGALYKMDGPDFFKVTPRPEKIKAAAWLAGQSVRKQSAGRRPKGWPIMLGRFVLETCAARQLSTSISHGMSTSPAVRLLCVLMMAVDDDGPEDESTAAKYLAKARRTISA